MKFNIDNYKGKYVMHCKTEEEAKTFCKYLHNIGHMWSSGDSYLSENYWSFYKASTCYNFNTDGYGNKQYYEEEGYTILEMEDFMDKEEDEPNCSNKNGIDHTEDVFKLLGLSPNEIFKVKSPNEVDYKINEGLGILFLNEKGNWEGSQLSLVDFLKGNVTIYKKPIPAKMEQLAIDYALACGYHWLAKDKDGSIYAYKGTPVKRDGNGVWDYDNGYSDCMLQIVLPISFLSWEDDEPYYIGD